MTGALLKYEGYVLYGRTTGYSSFIDGESIRFDTVAQWVQYINLIICKNGNKSKESNWD